MLQQKILAKEENLGFLHKHSFLIRLCALGVLGCLFGDALPGEEFTSCQELICDVSDLLCQIFKVYGENLRHHSILCDIYLQLEEKSVFPSGTNNPIVSGSIKAQLKSIGWKLIELDNRNSAASKLMGEAQRLLEKNVVGITDIHGNIDLDKDAEKNRETILTRLRSAYHDLQTNSCEGIEEELNTLGAQIDDALEATAAAANAADAAAAHMAFEGACSVSWRDHFAPIARQAARFAANARGAADRTPGRNAESFASAVTPGPRRPPTAQQGPVRQGPVQPGPSRIALPPTNMLVHWGDETDELWTTGGRHCLSPLNLEEASRCVLKLRANPLNKQRFVGANHPTHQALNRVNRRIPTDHQLYYCTYQNGTTILYHQHQSRRGLVTVVAIGQAIEENKGTFNLLVWLGTRHVVMKGVRLS
ncbi:MAG: hypothetical protein AAF355_13145 [Myxococcota bacterium]